MKIQQYNSNGVITTGKLHSNIFYVQENKEDQVAALYGAPKPGIKKPNNKKKAEKFIKEDHSDTNMLVAIRIRPLNQKEIGNKEQDIIRSEDKLLVFI